VKPGKGQRLKKIKRLIFRMLFFLGLPQRTCRKRISILFYHGFTDRIFSGGIENRHGNNLLISRFEEQVKYLSGHHRVIPMRELLNHLENHDQPPDHTVILTFDDGYDSNYELAYPVLKKYGLPAEIYVTTDFAEGKDDLWPDRLEYTLGRGKSFDGEIRDGDITARMNTCSLDNRLETLENIKALFKRMPQENRARLLEKIENKLDARLDQEKAVPSEYLPLTWEKISEMVRSGLVSIGSHGRSHVILARCGPARMRDEVTASKRIIEKKTARPCDTFAYPNGQIGDFNEITRALLKEQNFRCALSAVRGYNDSDSDIFALKRISISNEQDRTEFLMALYCAEGFGAMLSRFFQLH